METNATVITARSQRQAMDWSLVLASQGIETTIDLAPESGGWILLIGAHDAPRAFAALRQYRLENRGWTWQQPLSWSGLTFHWGAAIWAFSLALIFSFDAGQGSGLRSSGAMDSVAVRAGQWWRLLTAVSLHSDLGHLAANLTFGFLLLGLAMARYGAGLALLAAFLAGGLGNVFGLIFNAGPYRGVGASGMVMGALGLMTVQSLALWQAHPRAGRLIVSGLFGGTLLFVLLGLDPKSDVVAHLGGFVGGLLFGGILAWLPAKRIHTLRVNLAASLLLLGLFFGTWWLALR
ncbi:MAG: rhomboid family intramembrane serine protease [Verrucomicrobia bacterium]|nr:rhomboid family intramembrane serine protease [Verrucomicrobiota bacterium]